MGLFEGLNKTKNKMKTFENVSVELTKLIAKPTFIDGEFINNNSLEFDEGNLVEAKNCNVSVLAVQNGKKLRFNDATLFFTDNVAKALNIGSARDSGKRFYALVSITIYQIGEIFTYTNSMGEEISIEIGEGSDKPKAFVQISNVALDYDALELAQDIRQARITALANSKNLLQVETSEMIEVISEPKTVVKKPAIKKAGKK